MIYFIVAALAIVAAWQAVRAASWKDVAHEINDEYEQYRRESS